MSVEGLKKKKERSANFSPVEIDTLVQIVQKYSNVLECKKTDAHTWKEKEECWEKLASDFNSINMICPRTAKCLKTKYECLKKEVRKKRALQQQEIYRTGGGEGKPIVFTPTEDKLLSLMLLGVDGMPSRNDDDKIGKYSFQIQKIIVNKELL